MGSGGAAVAKAKSSYYRSKPRTEKDGEVGVRYTPVSTPSGGVRTKTTIMKTAPSGELARKPGVSPGDVMATIGSVGNMTADQVAANLSGRTDVNVATLGDLARRARVGGQLSPIPTPSGVGLQAIGRASATDTLTKLASDTPTIDKIGDKPSYAVDVVKDPRGGIGGVVKNNVYSGKVGLDPSAPTAQQLAIARSEESKEPAQPIEEIVTEEEANILAAATKRGQRGTKFKRVAGETIMSGIGALYRS